MTQDVLNLLEGLFDDLNARAPFGVTWVADSEELPMRLEVTPADLDSGSFTVDGASPTGALVRLAGQLQDWLHLRLKVAVPPCPKDGSPLLPRVVGTSAQWACEQQHFECEIGGYLRSLWPPHPEDPQGPTMLATRLNDRGVRWISVGLARPEGTPVAKVRLVPGEDEFAVRSILEPFLTNISWGETPRTERFTETTPDGNFRGLRLHDGRPHWMAALTGPLDRPGPGDDADILVRGVAVRLAFAHRVGEPGQPLLLEMDGTAFADTGETATCGGGVVPPQPGRPNGKPFFYAWQMRIREN